MNRSAAILAECDGDYRRAFEGIALEYERLFEHWRDQTASRFLKVCRDDDGVHLRQCTQRQVSEAIDLADQYEEHADFYYLTDAGEIVPLTVGGFQRNDDPEAFEYGTSDLIAAGAVVGHVTHTDH